MNRATELDAGAKWSVPGYRGGSLFASVPAPRDGYRMQQRGDLMVLEDFAERRTLKFPRSAPMDWEELPCQAWNQTCSAPSALRRIR